MDSILNDIVELLKKNYNRELVAIDSSLIQEGDLDSMTILEFITSLEKRYEISFTEDDFLNQDFLVPRSLAQIIHKKSSSV